MRRVIRLFLTATVILLLSATSSLCQSPTRRRSRQPPGVGLKVIPAKTILGLNEKLSASCEMTNVGDEMLCFPPTSACSFSMSAELVNPDGTGVGAGMGGACGGSYSVPGDLLADVEQRWVKLPPNQTHVTQCLLGIEFSSPGRWKVYSGYRRVKVSSGQKSLLRSIGCKVLEMDVMSDPIEITVVGAPSR